MNNIFSSREILYKVQVAITTFLNKRARAVALAFYILKLRRTWSSWEWNYVTDVSHASDVH